MHTPLGRWVARVLSMAALVAGPAPVHAVQAVATTKHVLVLYSTSRDSPMSNAGDLELPRILDQALTDDFAYYAEYLDQGRFPDRDYQMAFGSFLRVKYSGQRIDLIIAVQAAAVRFVGEHRDELFPGTPVVFLALSPPAQRIANSTGVIADLDLASTLHLAVALQPDLRNVFVVSGAGAPDREYERLTRLQLKPFEQRLAITYLAGLKTRDLDARLTTLPAHSIVYYLVVYEDGAGQSFAPKAFSEHVAEIAKGPTYTWSDALMGLGVVGGSLLDRQAMMTAVGQLGARVLQGESADSIPFSSPKLNVSQVDWRQLRRWGIGEARVPEGTVVMFRELSVWDRYKVYIVGAVSLLLAQTALIAALLLQRTRRREAEAQVRGREAELRKSHERVHDLGSRLLNAQEGERARIARELHDDISQQMALLEIDLEQLDGAGHGTGEGLAVDALNRARLIARSVHELSHSLHPAKLRLIGLVAALDGLRRELSNSKMAITFTHDNVPPSLPPDLTLCLFRVVQEALQNAIKYSHARQVAVELGGHADAVTLTVTDDGVGFDVDAMWGKGLGLLSIAERLEAMGGTLKIHSSPGAGTRLEVKAPLPAAQDSDAVAV